MEAVAHGSLVQLAVVIAAAHGLLSQLAVVIAMLIVYVLVKRLP
jgi:hypothetical protein